MDDTTNAPPDHIKSVLSLIRQEAAATERERILRGLTSLTLYCDLGRPEKAPPADNVQPGIYLSRDDVARLVSGEAEHSATGSQSPLSEDPA